MTKRNLWIVVLRTLTLISLIFLLASSENAKALKAKNPDEEKQIVKGLEDAWYAIQLASHKNDISLFDYVFVDTRDYKPSKESKELISKIYGKETAENAGYSTAMKAKYIGMGKGIELLAEKTKEAKQENKELDQNYNQMPYPPIPYPDSEIEKMELVYESIEINEDKAIVIYRTTYLQEKAILVKINGKWLVSSMEVIYAGF